MVLECDRCKKSFSNKKTLYRHQRVQHNIFRRRIRDLYICNDCADRFSNKRDLLKHINNVHLDKKRRKARSSRLLCPLCSSEVHACSTYNALRCHLIEVHGVEIRAEHLTFEDERKFVAWKKQVEDDNSISYVQDTAGKLLSEEIRSYFNCHRSHGSRLALVDSRTRLLKSLGTNKIGRACPSTMNVTKIGATVEVDYFPVHLGHQCEVRRLMLPIEEKDRIAGKLAAGVTVQYIIDEIRDKKSTDGCPKRIDLLEKRDIHNIIRDRNIYKYSTRLHPNDSVSVKLWTEKMLLEGGNNPVLYYKEQGTPVTYEYDSLRVALDSDDFCIVIMTPFQQDMLCKFGNDKVCIDGTHDMNAYGFQLFTLLVCDEFDNGIPVAHFFSNRQDTPIYTLFFSCLKAKVGIVKAKVFMSDDEKAFYKAWECVMGPCPHQLLCSWHVQRNWSKNLSKIKGDEKKSMVFKTLKTLLKICNKDEFCAGLNTILRQLAEDGDTVEFFTYFEKTYLHRVEKWAYCYRLHLGINTNMYLENVHKVIKYFYLEGKKCKRIDYAIYVLLKLARDKAYERMIKISKNARSRKILQIIEAHRRSCNIQYIHPDEESTTKWIVTSEKSKDVFYDIERITEKDECGSCALKCEECKICVHTYTCTCPNNLIQFNICKHIHAARQYVLSERESTVNDFPNEVLHETPELPIPDKFLDERSSRNNEEEVVKLERMIGLLQNRNTDLEEDVRRKLRKNLDTALQLLTTGKENNFKKIDKSSSSNRKFTKQARNFKTTKNSKRKPLALVSNLESNIISQSWPMNEATYVLNEEGRRLGQEHSYF